MKLQSRDEIARRKSTHVDVCLSDEVEYAVRTTGFERIDLTYRALPESNLDDVDLRTSFLGKQLGAPILIGAMTGGGSRSHVINRNLATAAQRLGVGFMLGSQRVMLNRPSAGASFQVRELAPDVLLIGNLGIAQLKAIDADALQSLALAVDADAMALHANPLQEALQPAGDRDFTGILDRLEAVCGALELPIMLKEVGHGLSAPVAVAAVAAGVRAIDVAGAGGTSWAKVEQLARYGHVRFPDLAEWGTPTAEAVRSVRSALPEVPVVASGGVRSGLDVLKALVLGADVAAMARPLLRPALESSEAVVDHLEPLIWEVRVAMHCIGASSIGDLKSMRSSLIADR